MRDFLERPRRRSSVGGVPDELAERIVDLRGSARRARRSPSPIGRELERTPEPLLALEQRLLALVQRLLGAVPLAEVANEAEDACRLAVLEGAART